ncbi:unnamed protein product [Adineta steineri]|uniref:B30.2/SPRY domain-containing protein n=1 Tax=Adineta steineri TaxID=433720 RepID=A0A816E1Y5_9BILA|nr:unnamed protein product [Adineta steineri]CAF1641805.1 unnamed protein product [Adineta steineri]
MKETCATCTKRAGILKCEGCQGIFCRDDMNTHRNELTQQVEEFVGELDKFQETSRVANADLKSSWIFYIDAWETKSIQKIQETAKEARQQLETMIVSNDEENIGNIHKIVEQLHQNQRDGNYDERDLVIWKEKLDKLKEIVSKPNISVKEKKIESSFINEIRVNERDVFDQTCGDVHIKEENQLACHNFNLFGSHGEIRGKREYSNGIHRIRLKIETLDMRPWWFFGIISKSTPMQSNSTKSLSAYGWAGKNETFMNGQISKNMNGYIGDYLKDDIIELILDCNHRIIRMNNLRSTKSYELNVDLTHCPFPWMIHLNLFHIQTRIRIDP